MNRKVKLLIAEGCDKEEAEKIVALLKPKPGAPGSAMSQDEPPDDGGTPKGPGGH